MASFVARQLRWPSAAGLLLASAARRLRRGFHRFSRPSPLATRVLRLFLVCCLAMLLVTTALVRTQVQLAEQQAQEQTDSLATLAASSVGECLMNGLNTATTISRLPLFWSGTDEDRDRILAALAAPRPEVYALAFMTADFQTHGASNFDPLQGRPSLAERAYARQVVETGQPAFASEMVHSIDANVPILPLAFPVHDAGSTGAAGYLVVALKLARLPPIWDDVGLPPGSSVLLVDTRSGNVLASNATASDVPARLEADILATLQRPSPPLGSSLPPDSAYIRSWAPIDGSPWAVIVSVPRASGIGAMYAAAAAHVLMQTAIAVLILGLLVLLWLRSSARLAALQKTVGRWAAGDWAGRARLSGTDEIAELGRAFDALADRLQCALQHQQSILDSVAEGVIGVDCEGRVLFVNPAAMALTGYASEDLVGQDLHRLLHSRRVDGTPYPRDACPIQATLREGGVQRVTDDVCWRKDGTSFAVEFVSTPIFKDGQIAGAVVTISDVTERRRVEEALRASEARKAAIIESALGCVISFDHAGLIVEFNPAAEQTFGYQRDQVLGQDVSLLLPERSREPFQRSLARGFTGGEFGALNTRLEWTARRADGSEFPAGLTLTAVRYGDRPVFTAFLRDLTEIARTEIELRQAQKLEAVGRLAAGVAHEINTPIQFVGDNTHFVRDALDLLWELLAAYQRLFEVATQGVVDPTVLEQVRLAEEAADLPYLQQEIPRALDQALEGVERVASIVRALKVFAHPDQPEQVAADLNQALRSAITVARNEWKYVAEVETDFGDLPPVTCRLGDVNQVLLNLLVNAAHAIADVPRPDGEKGRIRIRTAHEGDAVVIQVSDTGCGIPEAIRERIFDPFFTTKGVGRGTGQGLALARSVVRQHGGTITVDSEVGVGSTFTIRLPVQGAPLPLVAGRAA